jgi:CheY-like chemotaxis protein
VRLDAPVVSHSPPHGPYPTLLVVENEPTLRFEVALCLGAHYSVASVGSAHHALELFVQGATFDLVLCELRMPEMDGIQLCEHLALAESAHAARVVLMSEGVPDAPMREALEGVPNLCIWRPFEEGALVALLEACRTRDQSAERTERSCGDADRVPPLDAECVFALAVRLMHGEVLDLVDRHGGAWSASATALRLERPGDVHTSAVVEGSAADVAIEIVKTGLHPRQSIFTGKRRSSLPPTA